MKHDILELIDNEIKKYNKRKIEYLEVGGDKLASKYEDKEYLYECIFSLVLDGYKYREEKKNETKNMG